MPYPHTARQNDEVPAEDAPVTNGRPFVRAENINHPPAQFPDKLRHDGRSYEVVAIVADCRPTVESLQYKIRCLEVQVAELSRRQAELARTLAWLLDRF